MNMGDPNNKNDVINAGNDIKSKVLEQLRNPDQIDESGNKYVIINGRRITINTSNFSNTDVDPNNTIARVDANGNPTNSLNNGYTNLYMAINNLEPETLYFLVSKATSEGWQNVSINSAWRPEHYSESSSIDPHSTGRSLDISDITTSDGKIVIFNKDSSQYLNNINTIASIHSDMFDDHRVSQVLDPYRLDSNGGYQGPNYLNHDITVQWQHRNHEHIIVKPINQW